MYWDPAGPAKATGDERFTAEIYFGPSARPVPGVIYGRDEQQAFLVEMGPDAHLGTHFHPVDQFQVFVSGSARFGRHDVAAGGLHYTDASTPYGPLTPGRSGIGFLTLRARTDSGASFMPDSRDELRHVRANEPVGSPHRNTTWARDPAEVIGEWAWLSQGDDGLRVGRITVSPGSSFETPAIGGKGAYVLTLDGGTVDNPGVGGASAANGHLVWLSSGTESHSRRAGDEGAVVALLQFPS